MSLLKILRLGEHARLGAGKFAVKIENFLITDENGDTFIVNAKFGFDLSRKNVKVARRYFSSVGHTNGTLDFIIKRSIRQWAEGKVLSNMRTPPEDEMRRIHGPVAQQCRKYHIAVRGLKVRISPTTA